MHLAVIMDGNGRWAANRGLPRPTGHRRGARAVRAVIEAAPDCGVRTLTLYAFSADNWARPRDEVAALLTLFRRYLRAETARCRAEGVRIRVIGRRDRLPAPLRAAIHASEHATRDGRVLDLRIAIDYSSRDALLEAARNTTADATRADVAQALGVAMNMRAPSSDVDLLIRTGGEQRLSDFLLWECAYAELFFTRTMWPDFTAEELSAIITEFRTRERRFGRVPDAVSA